MLGHRTWHLGHAVSVGHHRGRVYEPPHRLAELDHTAVLQNGSLRDPMIIDDNLRITFECLLATQRHNTALPRLGGMGSR